MAEDSTKPITPTPDDEVRRVLSLAYARRMEADMAEDLTLRPSVRAFAKRMEAKLREHDRARGKTGWTRMSEEWLLNRLTEEAGELARALRLKQHDKAIDETVDVANFAMFIADVLGD